jgi:hypothetical protein
MLTLTQFRLHQLDLRGSFKTTGIAFVGVQMNFQFDTLAGANNEVFKHCCAAW